MKTDTETLIKTMRILARDIDSEDGVANSAIGEAADRLEELQLELTETIEELNHWQVEVTKERIKTEKAYKLRKDAEIERDSLRDTMALDMLELTKQVEREKSRADNESDGFQRVLAELQIVKQERDEFLKAKICGMNRVDELIKERDEARTEVERLKSQLNILVRQRDEARNELQPLKLELSCALAAEERAKKSRDEAWCRAKEAESEVSTVKQSLTVRPEPSRLEIAAMLMAGSFSREEVSGNFVGEAEYSVLVADALIAAAKEGGK